MVMFNQLRISQERRERKGVVMMGLRSYQL